MSVEVQGTCQAGFEPVAAAFARNFVEHGEVGAAVHVLVDGDPVVDLWGGHADRDRTRAWTPETLVNVYSVGKGIVAAMVLQLVDDGTVELDAPVARYWPEFARSGKERGTVRQLLCHRIGVPALREPLSNADLFDFETMTAAVARAEPWWEPGERHAYHTNTYGHLTGGLIQAVSGLRPGDQLRSRLAGPLRADIHFGVRTHDLDRCADVIWEGPELIASFQQIDTLVGDERMTALGYANPPGYSSMGVVNTREWRQAEIPSTNGHASARGVATVYQGLVDGRVLSPDLLEEASRPQSSGWCPTLGQEVTFGLGFQPWTPGRPLGRTPGSYGHFGTGGALGFADPTRRVAFGYVMNHVVPRWQSPRNRALVDAVYTALG